MTKYRRRYGFHGAVAGKATVRPVWNTFEAADKRLVFDRK